MPAWAQGEGFLSVARTADELSVVCDEARVPVEVTAERGWACLQVTGRIPFTEIGILATLATALAGAGVSLFAVSTFDTDYLLVPRPDLARATGALAAAGHRVSGA